MPHHPDLLARLRVAIPHKASAKDLEILRATGMETCTVLLTAEEKRRRLAGQDAWALDHATQAYFVACWCAFVNQALGAAFLDRSYEINLGAVGYVPQVTADQTEAFFWEVAEWLPGISQVAVSSPYILGLGIPHELPGWVGAEPCPRAHLLAMFAACATIVEHAEVAVNDLNALGADKHSADMRVLLGDLRAAKTAMIYAADLLPQLNDSSIGQRLHGEIEKNVKLAIGLTYRVGQLAAMPQLIGRSQLTPRRNRSTVKRKLPLPSERGFNKWCLTDPAIHQRWRRDPAAVSAIKMLWQRDPDPEATLDIQSEINAANALGAIWCNGRGNYYCCPWPAIYRALDPITIGGCSILRGQTFTFDVSVKEGRFKREILVASFRPIAEAD